MAERVCPVWIGYLLLNPFRKIFENPYKILSRFVSKGMMVLEPGCGMGYFTLPLADMVGPDGKVIAADMQSKMLSVLAKRAEKAGFLKRLDIRQVKPSCLGIEDLAGKLDLVAAIHVVHEVPEPKVFFAQLHNALKQRGKILVIEPNGHVTIDKFNTTVTNAECIGFAIDSEFSDINRRKALLIKQ